MGAGAFDDLVRVGPGTRGGDLLRRYWQPVAPSALVADEGAVHPVRILGEDLVLFRAGGGQLGLIGSRCPHRGASLAHGYVDGAALRCPLHGWAFDAGGTCVAAVGAGEGPLPPTCARAYPVAELGGLAFAYLGPAPAPALPRYDVLATEGCLRDIGYATVPCNWFQIMENAVDPVHVEALHGYYARQVNHEPPDPPIPAHAAVAFDEFELGIVKRRKLMGASEGEDDWSVGHPVLFPTMVRVGLGGYQSLQFRVPIDDTSTWLVFATSYEGPEPAPAQAAVPAYEVPIYDDAGEFLVETVEGQDAMAWCTQGPITDRSLEHLWRYDRGVVMLRRMLEAQADVVAAGGDPIGVIRDPDHDVIRLPVESEKRLGPSTAAGLVDYGPTRHSPIRVDAVAVLEGSAPA